MKLVNKTTTGNQVTTQIPLLRRGAWLHGESGSWQMSSVSGPLENPPDGRELYHVITTSKQKLVVSRLIGESGMRKLRLESVHAAEPEPLFALLSA